MLISRGQAEVQLKDGAAVVLIRTPGLQRIDVLRLLPWWPCDELAKGKAMEKILRKP